MAESSDGTAKAIKKIVNRFRGRFTTLHPVHVKRAKMSADEWGDTCVAMRGGKPVIQIRINRTLPPEAQCLVLCHELGHALAWRSEHEEEDRASRFGGDGMHCAEFGLAYAQIWSSVMGG